ncbi:CLUMA_CG012116, isoform A [Clunio marinus]|uniref:CLUMA_CG012116, isoform A n=1 Tax=Clunio marinus TaxID=568069 RepID=A0A1J1IFA4_9DIPT|nr:CLUMA_CG012116, isoform A [Clunio marinus]
MENAPAIKTNEANLEELNKKIVEIKRKIVLKEGQKKANVEEWDVDKKHFTEKINDFKKEIKILTSKLKFLHNPTKQNQKQVQQDSTLQQQKKIPLPKGAKNYDEGVHIIDLQIIDLKKQNDLFHAKILKKQQYCEKLKLEFHKLINYKNEKNATATSYRPPETMEEDRNRKLITRLENEIHKMEVQWNEAEHIRKKYHCIKNSLMSDSERFESTLLKMEAAIKEQQQEINKLQAVYQEALQMRDATKGILSKQEQATNSSNRARERQAAEFRRQVENRKAELERLERKIFATGTKIIHQESAASSGKIDDEDTSIRDNKTTMEGNFKKLMTATGITASNELVDRFLAQREASARLTYLRNVTEHEKKRLESQREQMTQQLDVFKFSDNRENEVNQEELEKVKKDIDEEKKRKTILEEEAHRTNIVLQSIKDALVEMVLKLQEVDEMTADIQARRVGGEKATNVPLPDLVSGNISTEKIVKMLEEKVKVGMIASGQLEGIDSGLSDDEEEAETKSIVSVKKESIEGKERVKSPSIRNFAIDEKPTPYPQVYSSLITGRSTGLVSASPGAGGGVGSEEEADVPSRSFLKRQANLILDAKSRRKFRQAPATRRK